MTETDYSSQGAGKFVSLILPKEYNEMNSSVSLKVLLRFLDPKAPVGSKWEDGHRVLEFFWGADLNREKVNKALNFFRGEYPVSKIQFAASTTLTV